MASSPYKALKRIRIAVAVMYLVLLTLVILDISFSWTPIGYWVYRAQLIPSIMAGALLWIILWIVLTISFGRIYCSTICPLGTLMDAAAHMGRRFGSPRTYRYAPPRNGLRVPITIFVAVCMYLSVIYASFETIVLLTDPYHMYHRMVMAVVKPAMIGMGSVTVAVITLLGLAYVAWKRGRLLCNTVCPAGGLLSLLGRTPIYRVDINTDKCIHCGKCEDVCKSQCIDLHDCVVDNSRCVVCLDCTAVCPNEAITVRRGRFKLSDAMMQPTKAATLQTKATASQVTSNK